MDCSIRVRREGGRDLPLLLWRPAEPVQAIASAPHGGGMGTRRWVLLAQVPDRRASRDLDHDLGKLGVSLGLPGRGVALVTTGDVRRAAQAGDEGVEAIAAIGLEGALSLVAFVPERLSEAALVNAVATATEATVQARRQRGDAPGENVADTICIAGPDSGRPHAFGGPRSLWGARLARAVHAAVLAATSPAPTASPASR